MPDDVQPARTPVCCVSGQRAVAPTRCGVRQPSRAEVACRVRRSRVPSVQMPRSSLSSTAHRPEANCRRLPRPLTCGGVRHVAIHPLQEVHLGAAVTREVVPALQEARGLCTGGRARLRRARRPAAQTWARAWAQMQAPTARRRQGTLRRATEEKGMREKVQGCGISRSRRKEEGAGGAPCVRGGRSTRRAAPAPPPR